MCSPLKITQMNQLSRRHQEKVVVDQHYLTPDYLASNIIELLHYFILLHTYLSLTCCVTYLWIIWRLIKDEHTLNFLYNCAIVDPQRPIKGRCTFQLGYIWLNGRKKKQLMIKMTLLESWLNSMHITHAMVLTWERLVQIRLEFCIPTLFSLTISTKWESEMRLYSS